MAKLRRLTPIGFLVFGVLVVASTSWAQTRSPNVAVKLVRSDTWFDVQ